MIGNDKNDPFEEFEFRPINEGLGFHRKPKSGSASSSATSFSTSPLSQPAPAAAPISSKAQASAIGNSTLRSTAGASASPFSTPLPRNDQRAETRTETRTERADFGRTETVRQEPSRKPAMQIPTVEDDSIAKAQTAVNDILKSLNQKRQLDFATEAEKQKMALKKSKPQLFAAVLDGMLIIAAFIMTLILMLSITKVDMILNLTHAETSGLVYLSTISLFLAVAFIYMVVNRTFLGHTPGEWAFDQQCGREEEQNTMSYIPKVMLRSLIVMATGFVTLPFISYLLNKDMAGELSGVSLYKKPTGV